MTHEGAGGDAERKHNPTFTSATATVAARVRDVRRRRGWTAAELAERCANLGAEGLNRPVIANLESGRRKYVTIDEVLTFAYALDVAPIHLMLPTETDPDSESLYTVTPDRFLPIDQARAWVRGTYCPPGLDPRVYYSERPREEWSPPQLSDEHIEKRGEQLQRHRERVAHILPTRAEPTEDTDR